MALLKFADLRVVDPKLLQVIGGVLKSGQFILGEEVGRFASSWASYCNVSHCVPTASGTAALIAALLSCVPKDEAVILPALSFAATSFAVREIGNEALFCDVDANGLMDQEQCSEILSGKSNSHNPVGAVIPVHLYGQRLEISQEIISNPNIAVIEDACQAHGLRHIQGDAACFSFYPSKNLGAIGDAGAVVTDDEDVWEGSYRYTNYGNLLGQKHAHATSGNNLRMDEIQAAVLNYRLATLAVSNERRFDVAQAYLREGIETFVRHNANMWHLYPILVDKPYDFRGTMLDKFEIETGIHYPYTLPNLWSNAIFRRCPKALYISKHVVTLPIGPHMVVGDALRVVSAVFRTAEFDDGLWRVRK